MEVDENGAPTHERLFQSIQAHTIASISSDGEVAAGFVYTPFGEIIAETGSNVSSHVLRFNGKPQDSETGMIYYGARFYDPETINWTQGDPMMRFAPDRSLENPRRGNLYSFSLNNPLRYVDPDGFDPAQNVAPGEYQLATRTFIPGSGLMTFVGDNRSATTSPSATYRTGLFVHLSSSRIIDIKANSTGTSSWLIGGPGYTPVLATADVETKIAGQKSYGANSFGAIVDFVGDDPLVPFGLAPNIDMRVAFGVMKTEGKLVITGDLSGDRYPSAEVIIRDSSGNSIILFVSDTPYGDYHGGLFRLWGDDKDDKLGEFEAVIDLDKDGNFTGTVSCKRRKCTVTRERPPDRSYGTGR